VALTSSEGANRETARQIPHSANSGEFEALDRQMRSTLLRLAWVIVKDWSLAADAVQAAYLTLHQKWEDVLPENRPGWLVKAVQYSAQNIRRSQSSHDQLAGLWFNRPSVEKGGDNITAERLELLQEALRQLPDDQRQIVQLRLVEGLTFKAIANRLAIPLGTALSRMRLAVEKLRLVVNENLSE
jgi:RNA polymerase sigma factor (sigma-70 family)